MGTRASTAKRRLPRLSGWRLRLGIFAAGVSLASAAHAHDFFLLPNSFTIAAGRTPVIQATVGSSFPSAETALAADRIDQLYARGSGAPRLQAGAVGTNALNLTLTGARPGTVVAAVKVRDREVDYAEDRIPLILEEYRISREAQAAVEALSRPRTLRVLSRRFAKTIMCVRTCGRTSEAARPMGVALEFVATGTGRDHYRLLSMGRPLPDYPVDIATSDGQRRHIATDDSGVVHVPTDARGPIMLFAAVMTPPTGGGRFTLDLTTLTLSRP